MSHQLSHSRLLWLLLAVGSAGLVAVSVALTAWMNLHPCHLCILQRLLFLVLAGLGLAAALAGCRWPGRVAGGLFLLLATSGVAVAGYQSWLQAHPVGGMGCAVGKPGPIELLVEHLGDWMPSLFLATGLCEDEELVVLGLSLANWAALAFAVSLLVAAWAIVRCRKTSDRS